MNPADELPLILLAEDDDGHSRLIQSNLRAAGVDYPTRRVSDGQEALRVLQAPPAAGFRRRLLLLLDIRMPKLDGLDVLRRIRDDPSLHKLPVIVFTTSDDSRDQSECESLGCAAYLRKPIRADEFEPVMNRLGKVILQTLAVGSSPGA